MEQNKELFNAYYEYCKNENDETKANFNKNWEQMANKTMEESKEIFNRVIENKKMQNLLEQMTEEQQRGTIKFLTETLAYILLEKNTTGTTDILEKLKEISKA